MLQDIREGKTFKDTIDKARKVTVYICRHCVLLSMFRRFTELKQPLRELFAFKDWAESTFVSTSEGKLVENSILGDANFWRAIKYCLSGVVPIFKVLRLMDGDAKPALGYIYEVMNCAKDTVLFRTRLIVDGKCNFIGYSTPRDIILILADRELKGGLYDVIEKTYDNPTMVKIHEQLPKFQESIGMFGIFAAILMRKKMQTAKWWSKYGDDVIGCERNWSTFDQVHSKNKNRLQQQQRLNALVFVKYNIKLDMRLQKRKERGETYDPICLSTWSRMMNGLLKKMMHVFLKISHGWMFTNALKRM
ncbi:hypothetical protein OSB04_012067, partial [Centaurea solstitialis]